MQTHVVLMKLTAEGVKGIKDAPQRIEDGIKGVEAMGGKVTAFYVTMGEYDYVAIGEFPTDEEGMTFLLSLGSLGFVRTTTLKAFTAEQFAGMVSNLP